MTAYIPPPANGRTIIEPLTPKDDLGWEVWDELNQVFDRLPLAAVIDRDIFCIHGGIPRPLPGASPGASRLEMIQRIPAVSGINPPFEHEDEHLRQMASECIWSDVSRAPLQFA